MAKGTLVGLKGLRRRVESHGRRQHGDRDQGVVLAADYHNTTVGGPGNCESFTSKSHSCSAASVAYVPEAASPVTRDGSKLSFFGWIPCHTFNATSVASEICTVLDLRFLGVPHPQGTVGRASGNEVTCGIPGYCADSAESVKCVLNRFTGASPRQGETYVWEPGPREDGSWYVCVFEVENTAAKRSLAIGLRCGAGAILE